MTTDVPDSAARAADPEQTPATAAATPARSYVAVQDSDASNLGPDLAGGVPFFAIMIGVPAAVGVGIGALVRRAAD